jgi:GGDEF domain-containing protein
MATLEPGWYRSLGLGDRIDDKLYRDLVGSLFGTPKSILAASAVAVAIVVVAFDLSRDPVFLVFLVAFLGIGAARVATVAAFGRSDHVRMPTSELRTWELYALAGAWSFSALTGLSASYATLVHTGTPIETLTSCCAIGYIAGISSRNASRPLITVGQISAICVPFLLSLFYTADVVHVTIGAFILCLFLSTIVMSRTMYDNIVLRYQAHADLEKAALYDALTGLKNRAAFIQQINHDLATKARGEAALALIAIDLDNFKDVNDGLGHLAGDAVLKETARRISGAIRLPHEVSRIGGDEFLVGMRDVGLEDAKRAAASCARRCPPSSGTGKWSSTAAPASAWRWGRGTAAPTTS